MNASHGAASATATSTAEEPSPLLRLPGELRNNIYRLVVVSSDDITVGVTGFTEPPILTVSKQVRREASAILYAENNFIVESNDYDITPYNKWIEKLAAARLRHEIIHWSGLVNGSFTDTTVPNWANLLGWIEGYHAGSIAVEMKKPSRIASSSLEFLIMGGMFVVAGGMKCQPWHEVDRVLQEHRLILAAVDSRWNN